MTTTAVNSRLSTAAQTGSALIRPEPARLRNAGAIQQRQRLGGMLNYYYRDAA